ncbi:linear amide C-N hydrolase [Achromobacter aloeverae]|uniref:Choloylglycine hydrolase n=1 Tax=Achromobacter aloeverae TaxID=1750518 RepID=A0A4Q1HNG1_9BURK|nr:choloylglycine hydrolase family protein [Achromobacter aloeverae]RXN91512.1 choloylglycine hydrolase [Achromobacter aloeverae]
MPAFPSQLAAHARRLAARARPRCRRIVRQLPRRLRAALVLVLAAAMILAPLEAIACTSFTIRTQTKGVIYARTMEFGFPLQSQSMFIPRKQVISATGTDAHPGTKWTTKYATIGMNAFGLKCLSDGMNEKGLAGGLLYFPDYASYTPDADAGNRQVMAPWDLLTWALTNFANVAEVKEALSQIVVLGVKEPHLGFVPGVHYTLHDASGASIVIEPIDGRLKVYDNPYSVLTNSPPFDWHEMNLRNYVKLSPTQAPPRVIAGQTIRPLGEGSGLLGIPGDTTPPSRFIRALGFSQAAVPTEPGLPSVRLAEHILNNFDIPKGWAQDPALKEASIEYTQWSVVADLENLRYYLKTYEDPTLRELDFKQLDPDGKDILLGPLHPAVTPPVTPLPDKMAAR